MNEDKDKKAPEEGEERTVFMPGGTFPPAGGPPEPAPPAGPEPSEPPAEGALSDPEPPAIGPGSGEALSDPPPSDPPPSDPPPSDPPPSDLPPSDPAPRAKIFETPAPPAEAAAPPAEPAPSPVPPPPPAAPAPVGTVAPTLGEGTQSGAAAAAITPREARPIKVGDVLNHIFEVKRFLARGGMGEVFEGCNVNTDEKVAIKVMLPAMAADEKVVAMFRKEARTLTKLQHEALVQYRVLAQEPTLGALYIVTEFIEGVELSEMLGKVERTPEELAGLLKRLASGLSAAHRLGAIHRDISPDNVLLPGGDVHQAKIIDFGIAKDLDASSATIVGDGFAGKLNYVAPEQLGDFGREVGPWTDVYSLALVILAVAQGKNVNMSGSLVDAIDKRRKGPDLAAVPGNIRRLVEDMLKPDPKERLRSMDEVLARLGGAPAPAAAPPPPPPPSGAVPGTAAAAAAAPGSGGGAKKVLLAGGVAVAVLAAGAGAWYMFGDLADRGPGGDRNEVIENEADPVGDPVEAARNAINSALPSVTCTWLDIANIARDGDGVQIAMRGVAADDGSAAQRELAQALTNAGVANARLDFGDVAPITPAGCAALDTYRQIRATSDYRLTVEQPRFEMALQPPGTPYANQEAATAAIDFDFGNTATDFAILGIEPSGAIAPLIPDRGNFQSVLENSVAGRPIADLGNGRYRLNIDLDHMGWSGIILLTGSGPFDADVVAPPFGSRGPSWQQSFLAAAAERNWRVEMVWFESVNRQSGDRAPTVGAGPTGPQGPAGGEGDKPTE